MGGDFINELESAYEAIAEFPGVWPQLGKGFQRYILSRFPFAIVYRQSNEKIYVVAVMHQSRKPGYWLNRIKE
ncbi:MAG: type II toxin-antitoxin system RelE/ParE family toxin [Nitrosomonas sp. PRO4]|nr:type II toxin-antitoxin system RelE/ParE family toxin [Nitrosomonas sp. PRO4]